MSDLVDAVDFAYGIDFILATSSHCSTVLNPKSNVIP
jgi:hypothetical protein